LANFLLGRGGERTLDDLLTAIRHGGANTRKQAAFHLARNLAEADYQFQLKLASGDTRPAVSSRLAPPRLVMPRRELAKVEAAFEGTSDDFETRRFLIAALGLAGDSESVACLGKALDGEPSGEHAGELRAAILLAMARIASDQSMPFFEQAMDRAKAGEGDAGILNVVAAGLGNLEHPRAGERLVEILNITKGRAGSAVRPGGTGWKECGWTAAVNLAKRRALDPEKARLAVPVLLEAIEDIHQDAFRPSGERLFHGAGGSGGFLPSGVTSQGDDIREQAALQILQSLVYLDVKESAGILKKVSSADPNLRVRSAALDALKTIDAGSTANPAK
jgi:HEAT repeat protein